MVAEIARDAARAEIGVPMRALLDARDALEALRAPRQKTDAERKLDDILQNLKAEKTDAAREAARRKIAQIKARLQALKLAAGSAAATGDAKLARKVAKDIRDAARELGKALNEAGSGSGVAPAIAGTTADSEKAATQQKQALAAGSDLAALKGEAAELVQELKKIMRKLRQTGLHPGLNRKDRGEMDRTVGEAERALSGLQAAAAPATGGAVDITA
ncbi:hypothetical protein [Ferrovibrio terrae]|uniref:hypothetical protein n=1 Tax=Ferrovibrio terrae TaxID=2594003 RepID=UPI003137C033